MIVLCNRGLSVIFFSVLGLRRCRKFYANLCFGGFSNATSIVFIRQVFPCSLFKCDHFHTLQLCKSHPFQHLSDFDIASTLHLGDDNDPDATDAREETEFSFVVPQMEGDKIYQKQLEALCELMSTFETFQKNLRSQDLPHVATVCMVILSRDVYPQEFE